MKKFISAASAMAMVASLVGSAIPFAAVAAEASKTVELRPYVNKDGSAVSTTISAADIAAGDVTIPVGLYYVEKTNDTKSIRTSFGISSKDGDASNKYVTFGPNPYIPGSTEYFTSEQKVTTPDGDFDFALIPGWEGALEKGRTEVNFYPLGSYTCMLDTKQDSQNFKNAWGSFVWAQPTEGGGAYEWTGAASDDFPCYVFDVNFAKGTPAGTYTIDFINMVPDEKYPNVYSTMIESNQAGLVYAAAKDNLVCKSLTITIEGEGGSTTPSVTTTKPNTTKPTTTKPVDDGSTDVQGDFVVTGSELKYKKGDEYKDAYIDFKVQSGGHKGSTLVFEVDALPAGIKYSMTEKKNLAIPGKPTWGLNGQTYNCECRDANQDPQSFVDGEIVCTLTLDIPSDIAAGEYDINLSRFHVVEQGSQKGGEIVEFDAKVVPGKVIIEGDGSTDPTKPGDSGSEDVMKDFVVSGSKLEYNLGDEYKDAYIDFTVQSGGHKGSTLVFEVDALPAGIKYSMTEKKNLAIPGKPTWGLNGQTYNCECRDANQDPQSFVDGEIVCTLTLDIPSDIAAGEYDINLSRFHVVEQGSQKGGEIVEFDATVEPGKVIIKGSGEEPKVTTTTKDDDEDKTTTTTAPVGDVLYGDTNCDGKVNIADVVVLNKWLNDNSAYDLKAQGKINADCCDAKAGTPDENDSKAIIQSLVHLVNLPCKAADLK